ncbi:Retrotransposon gag protein [Rhizoctonia solani]|uniref:Retrotransposon gag protein n=1 Tax=Rhizoctonia solani TaxID=456999 RepID=A0A8H7M0R8_9AGAM|nr:Retrotransposon gag protein [Rhizoctonia solani]
MEPEPTLASLLEAINTLTSQVGSLQAQIHSQGQQLSELKAICKETNDLVGDKDQGGTQAKPGPSTGPVTPPTHSGGEAHTPGTVRPGLKAPFRPSRGTGFDSEEEEEPGRAPKKEPCDTLNEALAPSPLRLRVQHKTAQNGAPRSIQGRLQGTKGNPVARSNATVGSRLGSPYHRDHHQGRGKPPYHHHGLNGQIQRGVCRPDAKRAAARKIAALTQTTTTSEYVTKFRNLMAELDWNTEAYIAQFVRGLHWKVKELLSTKDNLPDNDLEAIFAASVKIDNIRRENEENRPKKTPAKPPAPTATTSTTTTQRVRLSEDPNYVTPEERDRRRASGLCVKCGQKGHGINSAPMVGRQPSRRQPR